MSKRARQDPILTAAIEADRPRKEKIIEFFGTDTEDVRFLLSLVDDMEVIKNEELIDFESHISHSWDGLYFKLSEKAFKYWTKKSIVMEGDFLFTEWVIRDMHRGASTMVPLSLQSATHGDFYDKDSDFMGICGDCELPEGKSNKKLWEEGLEPWKIVAKNLEHDYLHD